MNSARRLAPAALVLVCVFASIALAFQPAPATKLPPPTDKLVVVVSPKDDTVNVLLVNKDPLDLLKSIKVGKGPQEVCLTPDGSKAYVSNTGGEGLTVIDLATLTATGTVPETGVKNPVGAAFTPDGTKLYVGARGSRALVVLSPAGQILKQVPMKDPTMVVVSPDGGWRRGPSAGRAPAAGARGGGVAGTARDGGAGLGRCAGGTGCRHHHGHLFG